MVRWKVGAALLLGVLLVGAGCSGRPSRTGGGTEGEGEGAEGEGEGAVGEGEGVEGEGEGVEGEGEGVEGEGEGVEGEGEGVEGEGKGAEGEGEGAEGEGEGRGIECPLPVANPCLLGEGTDELCSDGIDNDGDSFADCRDFDCTNNPCVTACGPRENTDALCSDGRDNDRNGYTDCRDFACSRNPYVTVCGGERGDAGCSDGVDNDQDGYTDCLDRDCENPYVTVCGHPCGMGEGEGEGVGEGEGEGEGAGDGLLRFTFIDVGQGDATLLQLPAGQVVLVDGGPSGAGEEAILPLLRAERIDRIDLLVLTHPHDDHCGGLDEVLEAVEVGAIWENGEQSGGQYRDYQDAREAADVGWSAPPVGFFRNYGEVELQVLHTNQGYAGENDDSLVLRVTYRGFELLLAADVEEDAQEQLIREYGNELQCDVLKAPHHGSFHLVRAFVSMTAPDHVAISCGEGNPYGHPHYDALEEYRRVNAQICRTDQLGNIPGWTDGAAISLDCSR